MATPSKEGRQPRERGNGQGTVHERANGRWRWELTLGYSPDGKRKSASGQCESRAEAERALAHARTDRDRGLLAPADGTTVAEYAERWLARQRDLRDRSRHLYRVELAYALEHVGRMKIKDVRPRHLKDLMARLAAQPMKGSRGRAGGGLMAPRTQAKVLTRLRSLFREAVSDQLIYVSPADAVRRVKLPPAEAVGITLDFHEAARLRELGEAMRDAGLCRMWPALFACVSVGLRRGEVMGLRWEDVDLERGILRVRQARTTDDGEVITTGTKTFRSTRDLPMPASLAVALAAHERDQARESAAAGTAWAGSGAVFATALGAWTHPSAVNAALSSVIRWSDPRALEGLAAGVRRVVRPQALLALEAVVRAGEALPAISPHDLRHTAATLMLRRRVPVEVVSKTLGHARISITLDVYRHVLESERREHVVDLFESPTPERQVRPVVAA